MAIRTSVEIDAPRDLVFEIITDYGSESKLRTVPKLKAQRVIEHHDNVFVCENEWEVNGKTLQQVRRYSLFPPDRIEEEVLDAPGPVRVRTTITLTELPGERTLMTHEDEYTFKGIWKLFGWLFTGQFARMARESLDEQKLTIEAEIIEEDVEEDVEPRGEVSPSS